MHQSFADPLPESRSPDTTPEFGATIDPRYPVVRFTAPRSPLPTRIDTDRDTGKAMLAPVAVLRAVRAHAKRPEPHKLHRLAPS